MTRNILFPVTITVLLGLAGPVQAQSTKQGSATVAKSDVKFLEDITIEPAALPPATSNPKDVFANTNFKTSKKTIISPASSVTIENATSLQFKYALLLDLEVEQVQNLSLFRILDEWMGTRYQLGGNSKDGIDCSALMQNLFSSLYGITLPRTAREQYHSSKRISRAELKEGDLIFFNTIGGISHVGMYLQNNKFIHASSSGVMISDLYEDYWLKHFIGSGRVEASGDTASL
jgi:lipoprotein Spr